MNLSELKQFIPTYKWRVQSVSKNYPSATCVAYIDARDVMYILDEVVGPENWQSDYKEIKQNLFAGVGIRIDGEWIWKWDCGTESKTESEKGEASDAFKRAAVKWGIGRFLYELPIQFVKTNESKNDRNFPYPVNDNGEKIQDLTDYLNNNVKAQKHISKKLDTEKGQKSLEKKQPEKFEVITTDSKQSKAIERPHDRYTEPVNAIKACKTLDELREAKEKYKTFSDKDNRDYSPEFVRAVKDKLEVLK
jgi:hypothetical protein